MKTEEYVDYVGELMYPKTLYKPYGYSPENLQVHLFLYSIKMISLLYTLYFI